MASRRAIADPPEAGRVSSTSTVLSILAFALLLVVTELRYAVRSVVPADAPATTFSGERARATLARLLGEGAPHPNGSAAAAEVRARLITELRAFGLAPETRTANACGRYGKCAEVTNVVALLRGHDPTGMVAIVAHTDSVKTGPGASDDGAGMATLVECARALVATPPRNDVLFVATDGEELGLVGAEAFVRDDPRARALAAVINVEARGVRGPSTLFQTGRDAGWLVDAFAREASRPVGSSLLATVYERMPNDTDLTVFLDHHVTGLNFAFSEGVEDYHSRDDDLAHQNPGSLQHEGESALAALRAAANADLHAVPRGQRVFFDVAGLVLVRYRASWALPLALVALLLSLVAAARAVMRGHDRARELAASTAAFLAAVAAATAIGMLSWMVAMIAGRLPGPWIDHPTPLLAALVLSPFVATFAVSMAFRSATTFAFVRAAALILSLFGVFVAAGLPGASYVLVVPGLAGAIAGLVAQTRARDAALPLFALGALAPWALVVHMLEPGLGFAAAPAYAPVLLLAAAPIAALAWSSRAPVRRRLFVILASAWAFSTVLAASLPQRSVLRASAEPAADARVARGAFAAPPEMTECHDHRGFSSACGLRWEGTAARGESP